MGPEWDGRHRSPPYVAAAHPPPGKIRAADICVLVSCREGCVGARRTVLGRMAAHLQALNVPSVLCPRAKHRGGWILSRRLLGLTWRPGRDLCAVQPRCWVALDHRRLVGDRLPGHHGSPRASRGAKSAADDRGRAGRAGCSGHRLLVQLGSLSGIGSAPTSQVAPRAGGGDRAARCVGCRQRHARRPPAAVVDVALGVGGDGQELWHVR